MQHRVSRDPGSFHPSLGGQWPSHTKRAEDQEGHQLCCRELLLPRAHVFCSLALEVFYCPVSLALFTDLCHTGRGFRSSR